MTKNDYPKEKYPGGLMEKDQYKGEVGVPMKDLLLREFPVLGMDKKLAYLCKSHASSGAGLGGSCYSDDRSREERNKILWHFWALPGRTKPLHREILDLLVSKNSIHYI